MQSPPPTPFLGFRLNPICAQSNAVEDVVCHCGSQLTKIKIEKVLKSVTLWDQDQVFVWSLLIQSYITDLQSTLITGTAFKTKAGQRETS